MRFLRWLFAHLFPRSRAASASRSFGAYREAPVWMDDEAPKRSDPEAEVLLTYKRACVFCDNESYQDHSPCVMNSVCRPAERVDRCKWKETHVHRTCKVCKAAWLSKLPEEKKK